MDFCSDNTDAVHKHSVHCAQNRLLDKQDMTETDCYPLKPNASQPWRMLKAALWTQCCMFHYNHMIPPNSLIRYCWCGTFSTKRWRKMYFLWSLFCLVLQPAAGSSEWASTWSHSTLFFTKYILKGTMRIKWCEVFVLFFCKSKKKKKKAKTIINQGKLIKSITFFRLRNNLFYNM